VKDFFLFLVLGIAFLILESTVLATSALQGLRYDLLIPLIIFVALYHSIRVGLPLCIVFGFFMDVFSGGVFGLFLSIYFWLFCFVKAILCFLDLQNSFLEVILVVAGVLIENLIVIFSTSLLEAGQQIEYVTLQHVIVQTLLAGATAPLMFVAFFKLRDIRFSYLFSKLGIGGLRD